MSKTWQIELVFVTLLLGFLQLLTGPSWIEVVGSLAVIINFAHVQVSDRLAEKEAKKTVAEVSCYRWATRYLIAKEILWLFYFLLHHSYSALAGVIIFLSYPIWRAFYRSQIKPYRSNG